MDVGWFRNAIIYGVNLSTFQDGNGDGVGDFRGLISRLDYLAELGVNCIWLLPFYPSPRRDNGYDVSNYYGIDPRYGTLDDFRDFVSEAKQRDIGVIIDLVVHHTSDRHPWFEAARSDPKSYYRDYYIWSNSLPQVPTEESFFPEVESGVWRYDTLSKSYFHHGFYHFQPDLNFANERVRNEVYSIVDFWLSFGIDGFRIDAAPLIIGRKGLPTTEVVDPGKFWQEIRQFVEKRRPEAFLLAEADIGIDHIDDYAIGGKGIHTLLNFWSNQTMIYALATKDKGPLMQALADLPRLPAGSQYINFLRNLDELNVKLLEGRLSPEQQDKIYKEFGPRKSMLAYGRGIRRRLAPMLGGDPARIKMAFSLLFSMPGSPMFVYGDEIGMGDNLDLNERDSVRTPMQWSNDATGGFSTAPSSSEIHRAIIDKRYDIEHLNVAAQQADPGSLLNFVKDLIALRRSHDVIGTEAFEPVESDNDSVVSLRYKANGNSLVMFHNLSDSPCTLRLVKATELTGLREVFADSSYDAPADGQLEIGRYGFRWFAL